MSRIASSDEFHSASLQAVVNVSRSSPHSNRKVQQNEMFESERKDQRQLNSRVRFIARTLQKESPVILELAL